MIRINTEVVMETLTATFYEKDGLLEISEAYEDEVIGTARLESDASDTEVRTVLGVMLGQLGQHMKFEREA